MTFIQWQTNYFFIEGRTIINIHPTILPYIRGVDHLEWTIIQKRSVGNTLHVIDERVDCGTILKRVKVPILENGTLKDVAVRMYEMENDLLASFEFHLNALEKPLQATEKYLLNKYLSDEVKQKVEDMFIVNRDIFIELSHNPDISV